MKVILISKVSNKGNIGDVVEIKDGYARNFLIPKNKAIHYSAANYKIFEDKKKEFESNNEDSIKKAEELKKIINGKDIIVIENASDDGRLYGAVNTTVIAVKVNEIDKSLKIARSEIVLEKIIKDTGVYNVTVNLYSDVSAKLRLIVSRNESEIDAVVKKAAAKALQEKDEKEEAVKIQKTENKEESSVEEVATQEETTTPEEATA
jgi:large subunit ribosomal protein L9